MGKDGKDGKGGDGTGQVAVFSVSENTTVENTRVELYWLDRDLKQMKLIAKLSWKKGKDSGDEPVELSQNLTVVESSHIGIKIDKD